MPSRRTWPIKDSGWRGNDRVQRELPQPTALIRHVEKRSTITPFANMASSYWTFRMHGSNSEVLEVNHEGSVPGSESKRDGYRARAERDRSAPICDSLARRERRLGRRWAGFAWLALSGDWDCDCERVATKGTPAAALNRRVEPLDFHPSRAHNPPVHSFRSLL